ncbi:MAG: hypothetical protein KDD99_32810, partial [Bacteroidetes bacterium]|nr:hypothetical protein [Bacteroidota bacterium]
MSKPYILTLIWLTLTTAAISQPLSQKLDTYFQQVKKSSPAPGFSVVIVKGKDIIFTKGYGQEIAG